MASSYYDSSGKEVVDGNIAYASDLNDINTAADTGFQLVEAAIGVVAANQDYYTELAEKWATEAEDTEVESGKYSAFHWAEKANDDAIATAADRVQTGLDRTAASNSASAASGSASAASGSALAASNSATSALGFATAASNSATSASGFATAASNSASAASGYADDASDSADAAAASALALATAVSDTAYGVSWNGVTTSAPSKNAVYDKVETLAPLSSPALTGTPTAPTATAGTNTTQIATTAFVHTSFQLEPAIDSLYPLRGGINGLDTTVYSGQVYCTHGSCVDSTGTVILTFTGSYSGYSLVAGSDTHSYVFIVRLVSGGTCTIKSYSTYDGPGSDATVDKWRFIAWYKSDSVGVYNSASQFGDTILWHHPADEGLLVTSVLTTSYVSKSLNSLLPTIGSNPNRLVESIDLYIETVSATAVYLSIDGTKEFAKIQSGAAAGGIIVSITPFTSVYVKTGTGSGSIRIKSLKLMR